MQIITLPKGLRMFHRDPRDPPVKRACTDEEAQAARDKTNGERARFLNDAWESGDEIGFDLMFKSFLHDDPQIIWALDTRMAALASVRAHKGERAKGQLPS